jgi:signal peptidase II
MARRVMVWMLLVLSVSLVGCDHATKYAADKMLRASADVVLIPGVLDLRYAENTDIAFSAFHAFDSPAKTRILVALSSATFVILAALWWRRKDARYSEQLPYALILAGALGNVIDRVARGYVVDFIHVHRWPVFNVADIAVTAGMLLLALRPISRRPLLH